MSEATGTFWNVRGWRNWLSDHLRLGTEERFELYRGVATSSMLRDLTYWAELLFSAGIATMGLTLNSPAVIIGAMLISPLMAPIMSGGLALAAGDVVLGMRAVVSIFLSSFTAILFSTLLVVLLPFREMTAEIAARMNPNTLDLVVALFSGAVGAIAVSKSLRGIATSLPGVAIAVALMPPLCVTGYGLGVLLTIDRELGIGILRGGSLLFVTNLVAITFSSMLVFLLLNIDAVAVRERIREWRRSDPDAARFQSGIDKLIPVDVARVGSLPARLVLIMALVVMVFVPLKRSFDALSGEIRERQQLNRAQRAATQSWEELFGTTPAGTARSYIDRLDAVERDGKMIITVRAFISDTITPEEREAYTRTVAQMLRRRRDRMDVLVVEIPTSTYQLAKAKKEVEKAPVPVQESPGVRLSRTGQEILARLAAERLPPGATRLDESLTIRTGPPVATLTYLAAEPISGDAASLIAGSLRLSLQVADLEVRLEQVPSELSVTFAPRSATLDSAAIATLDALAATAGSREGLLIGIQTQPGSAISKRRAEALGNALVARGIAESRIVQTESADAAPNEVGLTVEKPVAAPPG